MFISVPLPFPCLPSLSLSLFPAAAADDAVWALAVLKRF